MTASHIDTLLPTTLALRLTGFLREQGNNRDPATAVATAIEYWMENAAWKQAALLPEIFETGDRNRR